MSAFPELFWDNRTKNKIRERIQGLTDAQLIIRECNRTIKRAVLVNEWALAGLSQRRHLLMHLDDCIRLNDFELGYIHETMKKRGLRVWDEEFMKED